MIDINERKEDDEQIKRKASFHSIAEISRPNKNGRRSSGNSSDVSEITNKKKSLDNESSKDSVDVSNNSSKSIDKRSSQVQKRRSDTNCLTTSQNEENNLKELSLNKIYEMASNGFFEKKTFCFQKQSKNVFRENAFLRINKNI